ncbi:hypothetical protein, partial [Burkholderia sp. WAC0059]|uniref:hypothetical protein n=1 Tax=Burkholderia sp. WAC0059 TaxID=2066022 RepID=UPI001CA550EE
HSIAVGSRRVPFLACNRSRFEQLKPVAPGSCSLSHGLIWHKTERHDNVNFYIARMHGTPLDL